MAPKIILTQRQVLLLFVFAGLLVVAGCTPEGRGFALPPGDIEAGKTAFTKLGCNACHSVADIEWIGSDDTGDLHVTLGGETPRIKTYGELVTSIINPSHKIAQRDGQQTADAAGNSNMQIYNEVMTVQELVDLVTFLQTEYELVTPPGPSYPPYYH